jgi:hypothetical protein
VIWDETGPDPSLLTLASALIEEALQRALVWLPAEVTAYYAPGLRSTSPGLPPVQHPAQVALRVLVKRATAIKHEDDLLAGETLERGLEDDPELGSGRADSAGGLLAIGEYPPIPRALVLRFGLGSQLRARGEVPAGTQGIALVSSRVLDRWHTRAGVVDPEFTASGANLHNHVAGCAFIPCLFPGPSETADPTGGSVLGRDDGTADVWWSGGEVRVRASTRVKLGGDGATRGCARANDTIAASAAWTTFASSVATALTTLGIATSPPVGSMGTISSSSSKVLVE